VDTYAVQEPCWTNCLPGLLKSLGYQRAVLKNSTCWGGYHGPTIDADLIHWSGPDGTSLPAVPRYAGEGLIGPATIESSQPGAGFMEQSHKAGIENPAGTILQDMGWPGRPWRLGIAPDIANSMRHVTWREYVDTLASPPTKKWEASQEDLRVGLAWGATIGSAHRAKRPACGESDYPGRKDGKHGRPAARKRVPAGATGSSVDRSDVLPASRCMDHSVQPQTRR